MFYKYILFIHIFVLCMVSEISRVSVFWHCPYYETLLSKLLNSCFYIYIYYYIYIYIYIYIYLNHIFYVYK